MSSEKILVIVPARKGSKGLKNKNKLPFNGIPLTEHAFKISKELEKNFNIHTIVSSDDKSILKLAQSYFPDSGYIRSSKISSDTSSMNDTINDVIEWSCSRFEFGWVLLMQPTSPQRTIDGMLKFIKYVVSNSQSFCYASVSPLGIKKYELVERENNNEFKNICSRKDSPLRQKTTNSIYFEDGAAYMSSLKFIKKNKILIKASKLKYFEAHEFPIIDIDNKYDFLLAEKLYTIQNGK